VAHLGPFQSSAATISAAAGEGGPLGVRSRCEPMIGGTVCINVCTYGSVGALGGSPPGATRPFIYADECPLECRGDWIRTSDLLNPIQAHSVRKSRKIRGLSTLT